jgi:serine/threonine-protein kinase
VAALAAAAALVAGAVAAWPRGPAQPVASADPSAKAAATSGEGPTSPGPVAATTSVLFAAEPLDAHAFRDGFDLGATPLTIDVPRGQTVLLELRLDGYRSERVALDGAERRVAVKLERSAPAAPPASEAVTAPRLARVTASPVWV